MMYYTDDPVRDEARYQASLKPIEPDGKTIHIGCFMDSHKSSTEIYIK